MKRGQVSIFIIIGLLILFIVGFFVVLEGIEKAIPEAEENPIVTSVSASLSSCLEPQLQKAITLVSLHGGYFETPPYEIEDTFTQEYSLGIPYYFFNNKDVAPTAETINEQLALALESQVHECTDFSYYPYNISLSSTPTVTAQMTTDDVEATVTFPLEISTENVKYTLDSVSISVPSHLFKLYTTALAITEEQTKNPNLLCITCLSQLAEKNEFYLGMIELKQENKYTLLYILNDRNTEHETVPLLSFYFGHSFIQGAAEENPLITPIQKQIAPIGYVYQYNVIATGKNLTFSDDSSVFTIDPETGTISFLPEPEDIGSWIVTITATDADQKKTETSFVFEITDVVHSELSVEGFPYFIAHVGEQFSYTANVTASESVYFLDDTDLFDIDTKTGIITFTPSISSVGSHNFTITAIDTQGNKAEQQGYMVITK